MDLTLRATRVEYWVRGKARDEVEEGALTLGSKSERLLMRSHGERLSSQISSEEAARLEKPPASLDLGGVEHSVRCGVGATRLGGDAMGVEYPEPRMREALLRIRMARGKDLVAWGL